MTVTIELIAVVLISHCSSGGLGDHNNWPLYQIKTNIMVPKICNHPDVNLSIATSTSRGRGVGKGNPRSGERHRGQPPSGEEVDWRPTETKCSRTSFRVHLFQGSDKRAPGSVGLRCYIATRASARTRRARDYHPALILATKLVHGGVLSVS